MTPILVDGTPLPKVRAGDGLLATLSPAKSIVLRFFQAMADGDAPRMKAFFSDDARWWVPPSAASRVTRPLLGPDAIAHLASGAMLGSFQPGTSHWEVHHITEEAGRVAVHMFRHATSQRGQPYVAEYHWLLHLRDLAIVEVWEVLDTAGAIAQLTR